MKKVICLLSLIVCVCAHAQTLDIGNSIYALVANENYNAAVDPTELFTNYDNLPKKSVLWDRIVWDLDGYDDNLLSLILDDPCVGDCYLGGKKVMQLYLEGSGEKDKVTEITVYSPAIKLITDKQIEISLPLTLSDILEIKGIKQIKFDDSKVLHYNVLLPNHVLRFNVDPANQSVTDIQYWPRN